MERGHTGPAWADKARLAGLYRTALLDTSPEQGFDDIVRLATRLCATPVALVSLVDRDRQWFKARIGFPHCETDLDRSVCKFVLTEPDLLVIPDLTADPRTAANPLVTGEPFIRFYAGAPLRTSEGHVLGSLCVIDTDCRPTGLTPDQADDLRALARRVSDLMETRLAIEQQANWRSLFERLSEGFIIGEVLRDAAGRATDWRYVDVNAAWGDLVGVNPANVVGRTIREVFPGIEDEWVDEFIQVVETEQPIAFTRQVEALDRWYDGRAFPLDGERFAVLFLEVTARVRAEQRRNALLEVGDRLRDMTSVEAMMMAASETLGTTLNAMLVGYGDVDPQAETITVERDWTTGGAATLAGTLRFRDFGSYIEDLKRGETVVVTDCRTDPRTSDHAAALEARSARAFVNTPVFERGVFVALLYVSTDRDRDWDPAELAFIGDVATRTRGAIARQRAEMQLQGSEERLRLVVEGAKDHAILTTDPAGRITSWSAGAWEIFGWLVEEIISQPIATIFTPEDRKLGVPALELTTAREQGAANDQRWHLTKGGQRVFMNGSVHPLPRDSQGRERGFIKIARDETQRRHADEALRESQILSQMHAERVQLALAAGAIIGTWFWDLPNDRFTVDDAFAQAFGLDSTLGRDGLSLNQVIATVHPDDRPGLVEAINEVIARGGAYAHQYRTRRADGRYCWLEANGRVDRAPDGTPLRFPGVLIDLEERRTVEAERDRVTADLRVLTETLELRVADRTAELMQAEEALRQSQKMEAVGQLTGGLAHDFNNLLTGITGALELLSTRVGQGRLKDLDRYVSAAQGAAKRAAALTHRLLAFSRRQTLDPKPTDIDSLTKGMEELIRRTIGPAIELDIVTTEGLSPALVDPSQMENALLNLCINARDAMPDGGRLTVETANCWLDERAAQGRSLPAGQYVRLNVSDTGTGMPPDVIAKAFDPFFTTKPLGQGTGLGLSMIYGFARQSGGQVFIDSEVGRGTTVSIYLPQHLGTAEMAETAPDLADAPRAAQGETVLVVDDEPTVRMLVTEVLDELGYAAIEAGDGAAGLRVLQSDVRIDLLVTDVGLPGGMNGRQIADAARLSRPDLKVLFITGYAENAAIGKGHMAPGMHVMTKPFAMEALASRVRELIVSG